MMLAAAGALLLTGLALCGLQLRERARYPQVTFPDGTVLMVEGLTSGPMQELRLEPEFWTVLKKVLPPRWHRVTGPPLLPRRVEGHQGQHALWLSRRDPASGKYLSLDQPFKVEAVTAGGILFEAAGSMGFGSGERAGYAAMLRVLDWRADTLRLRVSKGDWQSEFSIPNPKRGQRFESWEAQPLPRTNRVKGFDIVLRGLRAFGDTNQPFWMPQGEIERDGRWAGSWFTTHWTFEDPTGNSGWRGLPSSEPIWKVRLVALPSPQFPFSSDELFPIGRIEMPGPGEFRVLPGRSDWTNAGLHAVLLTGPGNFAFTDGRNTLAQRPGEGGGGHLDVAGIGGGRMEVHVGSSPAHVARPDQVAAAWEPPHARGQGERSLRPVRPTSGWRAIGVEHAQQFGRRGWNGDRPSSFVRLGSQRDPPGVRREPGGGAHACR